MSYNDLVQLYFERSGALQSYWTLYVVVVGALLAFSSLRKIPDRVTTILVSVLFVIFAYQNLGGLREAAAQRVAILRAVKQWTSPGEQPQANSLRTNFESTLTPATYENIKGFHLVTDLLTFAALWAMELRRKRSFVAQV